MQDHRVTQPVNVFAGSRLDRRGHPPWQDADLLAHRLASPHSRFLPTWRGRHLVLGPGETPRVAMPTLAELGLAADGLDRHPWVFLGLDGAGALFALDLGALDDPAAALGWSRTGLAAASFSELRPLAAALPAEEAALLAQAAAC